MLLDVLWFLWWVGECVIRLVVWLGINIGLSIGFLYYVLMCFCSLTLGRCISRRRMEGKTVIITGANAGIGLETAKDLVMRGARVILACRDVAKAERAKREIIEATEAPADNIIVKWLDLASLKSVREFAADIIATEDKLDVLINNAGLCYPEPKTTEDGLEYNMACNHIGHFLLTHLLLDLLKKSAPSRIVVVSSNAHRSGDISPELFTKGRHGWRSYGDTKLANVVFAQELAKRLPPGVTVNSLHPGVVATNFMQHYSPRLRRFLSLYLRMFKTPEEGAQTTIYLAVSKDVEDVSGKYFADCKPAMIWNRQAFDTQLAEKFWQISEELTGIAGAVKMIIASLNLLWLLIEFFIDVGVWLAVYIGLPIGFMLFLFAGYMALTTGRCTSKRRMDGKTVIVTGANAGIGFETAKDLAMRGARVILACRNPHRAEKARADILRETEARPENVIVKILDLASLKSVREFADDILENESRLDVLVNNAGLVHFGPRKNTEDGLEYTMACNHYGHFLLTHLLLDLLKKSAPSRIVVVSALAHVLGDISPEHLLDPKAEGWKLYTDTKLANIVFAQELAKKLPPSVTVNSLHPGVIATNFSQNFPPAFQWVARSIINSLLMKTCPEGAQTTIYLAVSKDVQDVTGKYFSDCKPATVWNRQAHDPELVRKFWEISEKATGLSKKDD